MTQPLLEIKQLRQHFPVHGGILQRRVGTVFAVDGVDLTIASGETVGLVGESGCGKTTLGRSIARLYQPTDGHILFEGKDITQLGGEEMRQIRARLQMIFQDPAESLNPRHTIGEVLEEPFLIHSDLSAEARRAAVAELLERVGLPGSYINRYPHEFSGGQRQRIGIARAISQRPKLIICDEPVSALDVSIQSQVLNLLLSLQKDMNLAFLFIAHDLAVVRHVSDRVAVMYLGKVVEYTDADRIYQQAMHPYTRALIAAIPIPDPKQRRARKPLQGEVPSPLNPPAGCRFHPRCPHAQEVCRREDPSFINHGDAQAAHQVACHFAGKI